MDPHSAPTGQVFNFLAGSGAFKLNNGNPALFMFDSEDGAISGWNGGTTASIKVEQHPSGAIYKGLAISDFSRTARSTRRISTPAPSTRSTAASIRPWSGTFVDPNLPAGYAPFNDKVFGGELYVTYAVQDGAKPMTFRA